MKCATNIYLAHIEFTVQVLLCFFCNLILVAEIGEKLHDKQVQKYREQEEAAVALAEKKTTQLMRKEQQKVKKISFLMLHYSRPSNVDYRYLCYIIERIYYRKTKILLLLILNILITFEF